MTSVADDWLSEFIRIIRNGWTNTERQYLSQAMKDSAKGDYIHGTAPDDLI